MRLATLATLSFTGVLAALTLTAADPVTERLTYTVEWRLIHAGNVVIEAGPTSEVVKLESAGMVSALYKIDDTYRVQFDSSFCAASSQMNSREGSRHRETAVTFDRNRNRASLLERDVDKNTVVSRTDIPIPNCEHDVITGLKQLRRTKVEVGQSVQLPVSDGRKAAAVKIDAQERERITTPAGTFNTVRYEVNLLNGVVYSRAGRVFIWLTDDDRRLPVQIRLRMNFPLGTVTLELAKEEHP
ncbi:MAG: DUF3108 domain-containing protein [Acidobacteriia bacterium]|nr:DUF3108 domain-containing protein [Terriglobia bacterium]